MNSQSFNNIPSRIRLKFSRLGQARNLSHLEQIRELRRMVKASKLPYVVARCGKIQIPRMSFGPAISVGYESLAEYADLYLSRSESLREVFDSLQAVSEEGISVLSVKKIPLHFPSIEALVNVAEYEISGEAIRNCNDETIKRFLDQSEITVAKNKPGGRSYLIDAKSLIISIKLKNSSTAPAASSEGLEKVPGPDKSAAASQLPSVAALPSASGEGLPVPDKSAGGEALSSFRADAGLPRDNARSDAGLPSASGEGLPVPDKSADAGLHLMLRFGPKRNIKPERIIELLMKGHGLGESGAPRVCGGIKTPTGMAVEGGGLRQVSGSEREVEPTQPPDLVRETGRKAASTPSSGGMSQRFYSPVLRVARKELYWENSSGQLITP